LGGRPISFALGKCGDDGVGGLGSRLEILFCEEDGSTPFVVGEADSPATGLPFSIRYSYHQYPAQIERNGYSLHTFVVMRDRVCTSSITKTLERALRRLSQPILLLILVRRLYAFAKVPCNPGAGSFNKFGSV
jgi:hypothetical protein